jgi:hypothetical protein
VLIVVDRVVVPRRRGPGVRIPEQVNTGVEEAGELVGSPSNRRLARTQW